MTAFAESVFICNAPEDRPDAFLADSYAVLTLDNMSLRFQQYDQRTKKIMRDYLYGFVKIKGGQSKVAGMIEYNLVEEIKQYGDSLYTVYVAQSLSENEPGALMFAGHGYSWDWNYCRPN